VKKERPPWWRHSSSMCW